ncbi:MAG: hypothetical protein HOC23_24255 [Halieaceae bacterium]|nr:hypothetical protein [Halieaceae bacterium]
MSWFLLSCVGLVLLSALFYLLPGKRSDTDADDGGDSNLDWYRLRQAELAGDGNEDLQQDVQLRMLEDQQQGQEEVVARHGARPLPVWLLLPLIAAGSSTLYYYLGAAPDVAISRQLEALTEDSTGQQMGALIEAVEQRFAQRPGNLHYSSILGRHYMEQEEYSRASALYRNLARQAPGDSQALAYAAQAEYLATGRELTERVETLAERALAIDPQQRTVLGLMGMASFEHGRFSQAIEYWERLLALMSGDSESARMIASVIERARQQLGSEGVELVAEVESGLPSAHPQANSPKNSLQTSPGKATAGVTTPGVTVRVGLPEGASVSPADTVFVFARNALSDSRMPIAVRRETADRLPLTLRLDDSNSMAGQKISQAESIIVLVQVSPDGGVGEANATWLGQVGPIGPSLETEPLEILLTPNRR